MLKRLLQFQNSYKEYFFNKNMDLYKLMTEQENVNIYARDSEHILDLVSYYRERARKDGMLDDPRLGLWVRKIPAYEDLEIVDRGLLQFQVGMVDFSRDSDSPFFEELPVTPDFTVQVNEESMDHYARLVQALPNLKRRNLYKIQIDGGIFASLNFVPEDICDAMISYDLTPHIEKARSRLESIARVKAGHPNLG